MTDYGRIQVQVEASASSDYSLPFLDPPSFSYEMAPGQVLERRITVNGEDPVSVDLSDFTSVSAIVAYNRTATSQRNVLLKYQMVRFSKTFAANDLDFAAGPPATIVNDAGYLFTAATAERFRAGDSITVSGATEATNNGTFLVQAVSATTLTLAEAETITTDDEDAGTPTIKSLSTNFALIPPNGLSVISGNETAADTWPIIDTSFPLVLVLEDVETGNSAVVDLFILGT